MPFAPDPAITFKGDARKGGAMTREELASILKDVYKAKIEEPQLQWTGQEHYEDNCLTHSACEKALSVLASSTIREQLTGSDIDLEKLIRALRVILIDAESWIQHFEQHTLTQNFFNEELKVAMQTVALARMAILHPVEKSKFKPKRSKKTVRNFSEWWVRTWGTRQKRAIVAAHWKSRGIPARSADRYAGEIENSEGDILQASALTLLKEYGYTN